MNRRTSKRAMTLVEVLIYVAVFLIMLLVTTNVFFTLRAVRSQNVSSQNVINSAVVSLNRLTREIRNADSVDIAQSTFNVNVASNPGALVLNGFDDAGTAIVTKFYVNSGVLKVMRNGVDLGPLTSPSTVISNLMFNYIAVPSGVEGIRVRLSLKQDAASAASNFYTTVLLGGSN